MCYYYPHLTEVKLRLRKSHSSEAAEARVTQDSLVEALASQLRLAHPHKALPDLLCFTPLRKPAKRLFHSTGGLSGYILFCQKLYGGDILVQ